MPHVLIFLVLSFAGLVFFYALSMIAVAKDRPYLALLFALLEVATPFLFLYGASQWRWH
jgi:hypothetical protein